MRTKPDELFADQDRKIVPETNAMPEDPARKERNHPPIFAAEEVYNNEWWAVTD